MDIDADGLLLSRRDAPAAGCGGADSHELAPEIRRFPLEALLASSQLLPRENLSAFQAVSFASSSAMIKLSSP